MKLSMKRMLSILVIIAVLPAALAGCGSKAVKGFDEAKEITVITREAGSGTREAFIELTGILEKWDDGRKIDHTSDNAITIDGTQAVMSNVAGNKHAIGYISLGSLNDTVKAVKIDGVEAQPATVKSGDYKLRRPFNIATQGEPGETAQDFISFILSADGQKVVEDTGYISEEAGEAFASTMPSGKIVVAGSSSVSPVMEKLKEAYIKINGKVTIEIQATDSSSGMTSAIEGTCDIGMASRALKDSEKDKLTETRIALDGIAVIVNKENKYDDLAVEQVKEIFTGAAKIWSDIK